MTGPFLRYLLEAGICLGLFYLMYGLLLKKETFHGLKRAYLVVTMLGSLFIPLLHIPITIEQVSIKTFYPNDNIQHLISGHITAHRSSDIKIHPLKDAGVVPVTKPNRSLIHSISFITILFLLYLVGFALLTIRLAIQLISLVYQIRKHPKITIHGFKLVDVEGQTPACSFFHYILLPLRDLNPEDTERILQHEEVHIRQFHSLDALLAELLVILLWFNPFAWLYRQALRITHECLADAAVLQTGINHQDYLILVLKQLVGTGYLHVTSAMSLRFMKQRMYMMSRALSPGWARLKLLAGLPVLAVLLLVFSVYITPAPHIVSAAGPHTEVPMKTPDTPLAPVIIKDTEYVFNNILHEIETKDYVRRSYIYMQLACMCTAGWDIDYETLMPVSGYGLTFAYEAKAQSGAHFWAPQGTDERIARATGFGWEWVHFNDIEDCWQALKETINSGRPIHAPHMEEVLFIGYQEAENKRHRKVRPLAIPVFVDPGKWWSWKEFQAWFQEYDGYLGRFTHQTDPQSDKETAIEVLNTIVTMAYNDPRSQKPDMQGVGWGLAGIEAFAKDIGNLAMKERHFCSGWFGCHDSNPQWTARQLTARYLHNAADLFKPDVASLIREAAGFYDDAHQAWMQWDEQLGTQSPPRAWRNQQRRLAGARAVQLAAKHERNAIEKIQQALAAL
jgi:hypothetical protein